MNYLTTREFAEKWNVSVRTINMYLNANRIQGAVRKPGGWLIPQDAAYPMPKTKSTDDEIPLRKRFMPLWQVYKIGEGWSFAQHMEDPEERQAAMAAHLFFQGKLDEARRLIASLKHSESSEIRQTALLIHMMASVPLGDVTAERSDAESLRCEYEATEKADTQVIWKFIEIITSVFFHINENLIVSHAEWMYDLPEGVQLFALYGLSRGLYLRGDYSQALGVARSALVLAKERYPCVCIYLNLAATMASMNLNDIQNADRYFLRAWTIAEPDDYLHPFVEHHSMLQGQVERHFRNHNPELYDRISRMVVRFHRGWTKIHNAQSEQKVTDCLTPYEFSIAMMAAKNKSNSEIADFLHLSIHTVKSYLSVIYQKTGARNRNDLVSYVNR